MKKLILLFLTLALTLGVFASCDKVAPDANTTIIETADSTSTFETKDDHVVRATIIEINGNTVLIEPVKGEWELKSADRIWINVEGFDDIGAKVGSIVDVTYGGYIMETYPAQITASKWEKISDPEGTSDSEETESDIKAENLMSNITPKSVSPKESIEQENVAAMDFAIDLFKEAEENGKNTLLSPLSVLCALAMTANGADNETLEQMEYVLGMSSSELNLYLYTYINSLPQSEKYKLSIANSIWFIDNDSFNANEEFLQTNADYYGADIYKSPFDDNTVKDINTWVNEATDEMISEIIDEIPSTTIMYLINALAFEADWWEPYAEEDVSTRTFTAADGSQQDAEFMYGISSKYIDGENVKGFIKSYSGGKYAFVALLPDENLSLSDYISTLDGEKVSSLISNVKDTRIKTYMPKFECEYKAELSPILKSMGINDAFKFDAADFSNLGKSPYGNIFINEVLHKTYIQVGEKGTKAGAVTSVGMDLLGPAPAEPTKQIELNRPFVYMIIDCENNIPLFIGAMNDVG